MSPELVGPEQMARVLGIARGTLVKWSREGRVPYVKGSARLFRYSPPDVLKALQAGKHGDAGQASR